MLERRTGEWQMGLQMVSKSNDSANFRPRNNECVKLAADLNKHLQKHRRSHKQDHKVQKETFNRTTLSHGGHSKLEQSIKVRNLYSYINGC